MLIILLHLSSLLRNLDTLAMRSLTTIVFLMLLVVAAFPRDQLALTSVEEKVAPYRFNIAIWEPTHLSSKWTHLFLTKTFPYPHSDEEKRTQVTKYFQLQAEYQGLHQDLIETAATRPEQVKNTEKRLQDKADEIKALQPWVEETVESLITDELRRQEIPITIGPFIFPPVDIAFDLLPTILVTSPRTEINRLDSFLLKPALSPTTRDSIEEMLLDKEDLSSIVEDLGGLATYPAIVDSRNLLRSLVIGSHEWLHNHLVFHPLGKNYNLDENTRSLNETIANIFGEELGQSIYHRYTANTAPTPQAPSTEPRCEPPRFCFNQVMRETRLRVDDLLTQGNHTEAEAYMEDQRLLFVQNGYLIRKLNQAYFAFHGTYANNPSSNSPIDSQLHQYRERSPSLETFIHTLQSISSYDEFLLRREE